MAPKSVFRDELAIEDELVLRAELAAGLARHLVDAGDARLEMQGQPEGRRLAVEEAPAHLGANPVGRVASGHILELRHVPQAVVVAEQRERETEIVRRAEAVFELLAEALVCPAALSDPC